MTPEKELIMYSTPVADVMTRNVVSVGPKTPVKDIVQVLADARISAVPVLDPNGILLGVVSEADLLCRQEHQDDVGERHSSIFAGHHTREQWRKSTGLTGAEVMTAPALTITAKASLPDAARALARASVRRLFVVDDVVEGHQLVGVLSRRDLLKTFLRTDADLRATVEREVFDHVLHANPDNVLATVEHGVVLLTGRLEYEGDITTAVRLIKAVPAWSTYRTDSAIPGTARAHRPEPSRCPHDQPSRPITAAPRAATCTFVVRALRRPAEHPSGTAAVQAVLAPYATSNSGALRRPAVSPSPWYSTGRSRSPHRVRRWFGP
jgi:CBS domain-containing protein